MAWSNKLPHDRQVLALGLLAGLPAVLLALWFVWNSTGTPALRWTLTIVVAGSWIGFILAARTRVVHPLRTLGGLLAALREGDFSIQARGARQGDALGDLACELNALIGMLREQRLGALETTALLRTVMEEINLAVFAFDNRHTLRLVNRAGEKLLAQPSERLLGRTAAELGLVECLEGEPTRTFQAAFPGGVGRWGMRRSTFRQGGLPHQLLVIADLSQALREEERQAWQRLLRVLGHELNNSLAPIKSISGSLLELFSHEPLADDWLDDARHGLGVITSRADALSRFMEAYSRLARLPPPRLQPTPLAPLVRRVAGLETRLTIILNPGPDLTIMADPDQLEQLLINLQKNAADAAIQTHGDVRIGWHLASGTLDIWVEDEGPGLSNTTNLFVPFFTTKPGGSGIGLVLSRQIAEAHGGTLTLQNRPGNAGCVARFIMPVHANPATPPSSLTAA
jgi:two-component system, NtrC family, nitrogen regulation sensor histidine kinase NtrY